MDTIRHLLGAIVKLVLVIFVIWFVIWLAKLLYPDLRPSNIWKDKKLFSGDWLPAPRNLVDTKPRQGGVYGTEYQHGAEYQHGPEYNGYIQYGNSRTTNRSNTQVFYGDTSAYRHRAMYVRNLSVYEGGFLRYGDVFNGEARDSMFRNGIFPVVVVSAQGKVIASTQAMNTGIWATPGWARFQVTIPSRLPPGACTLVFVSSQENVQIPLGMQCQ